MFLELTANALARKLTVLWADIKAHHFSTQLLSLHDFGSGVFTVAHLAIIAAFIAVALWLTWAFLTSFLNRLFTRGTAQSDFARQTIFIGAVGLLISLIGICVAVLSSLDAVTRHALPGLFLVKFALSWVIADACINNHTRILRGLGWSLAASLVLASPVTLPAISGFYRQGEYSQRAHLHSPLLKLKEMEVVRSGQGHMYGEFWDAYRYAVLSETTLSPAPVAVWEGKVVGNDWLSIPKRFCAVGEQANIYIVKDKDRKLRGALSKLPPPMPLISGLSVFLESARDLRGCVRR